MAFLNFFKRFFKKKKKRGKKIFRKRSKAISKKRISKPKKKAKQKLSRRLVKKKLKKKKIIRPKKKQKKYFKKTRTKKAKHIKPSFMAPKEKEIGIITHYFDKISVGIIKVKSPVSVGEHIRIKGNHGEFIQIISSMQYNHKDITLAERGFEIGIKVNRQVYENDLVYKII